MSDATDTLFTIYMAGLQGLTAVVGVLIFLLSLDDLLLDLVSLTGRLFRRLFIYTRHKRLDEDDLNRVPEQPAAIMIPAWQEGTVIRRMLENSCATYRYRNYRIFVGVYPNDPDTLREVEAVARRHPNVIAVIGDTPGPTSKADCLNRIFRRILSHERDNDHKFRFFVIHDAEDVVHPLELKLLNYLIPRKDMVQLPVVALERPLWDFTGGHYMDEFAEFHTKDLVVREWLTGNVPCAGVGCGFSRRAMLKMAGLRRDGPFNQSSLTEDYDFSMTLNRLGLSQIFVRFSVLRRADALSPAIGHRRTPMVRDLVGTREYFPSDPGAAYRQKARWFLGIVFQGWETNRWIGSWRLKYALFRDRKGILTANLAILAYFIAINFVILVLIDWLHGHRIGYPPLAEPGGWVWTLLLLNGLLLINRSIHRAIYTYSIYGLAQALVSIPRQVWGNVINFMAASRAMGLYFRHKAIGTPLRWEKTPHAFPSEAELRPFRNRLGQMLKSRGALNDHQLALALARQRRKGGALGESLLAAGQVSENVLYETLSEQTGLPLVDLQSVRSPAPVPIAPELLRRHGVVPVAALADGTLQLATAKPLTERVRSELAAAAGRPVSWALARPSQILRLADPLPGEPIR
ncbi:MAG: glycosyl transferase family protein [Alphaproteobacteria bacterium]|nr:MAG: glycosyl transferase family protein [Alphaproteobacteria bacterium]